MGVKVADSDIRISETGIRVSSVSGDVQKLDVSSSSLVEEKIEINDSTLRIYLFYYGQWCKKEQSL